MQITQELTQLCAALSQATGTTIPTTQHLHFTAGKIFASNLETSITANYPHDLDFAVDAKTFVEAIKATPDGVVSIKPRYHQDQIGQIPVGGLPYKRQANT